jgi:leucine efflux protein
MDFGPNFEELLEMVGDEAAMNFMAIHRTNRVLKKPGQYQDLMLLSAGGVASLLKTSPELFYVVKYIGAAYLAWIGLQMLRGAVRNWRVRKAGESVAQDAAPADESHPFKKALIISLLNPKAILFFISFFIQFVDPAYPHPALTFLILGAIVQLLSFLYLSTLIFAGVRLAAAFRARRKLASICQNRPWSAPDPT